MYNLYDEENPNIEEQLYYYIDNDTDENIEDEETEDNDNTEITIDYLNAQEKLSDKDKDIIIFTDKVKNKTYQGKVIGHSTNNDGKYLFSVVEYNSSDNSVNKIFSVQNIVRYTD